MIRLRDKLSALAASARSFDAAGIKFGYPAGCNWEAKRDGNGHPWTMEGPDVTLMTHCTRQSRNLFLATPAGQPSFPLG
jgi:hypothetical protein